MQTSVRDELTGIQEKTIDIAKIVVGGDYVAEAITELTRAMQ